MSSLDRKFTDANPDAERIDGGAPSGETYSIRTKEGKLLYISNGDYPFFNQLRLLPAYLKIEMLRVTEWEMEEYIGLKKKELSQIVLNLFKKKWYWAETGDEVEFTQDYIFQDFFDNTQTLKQLRSELKKQKVRIGRLQQIISLLQDRSKIYNNETR